MKVSITVKRLTTYSSIVEMDEQRFKKLTRALDSDDRTARKNAEKECNHLIDTRDWQEDELESVEEVEEFKES